MNILKKPLSEGQPGECILYHEDKTGSGFRITREVKAARRLYNDGRVELVMKRTGYDGFLYIAIFRRKTVMRPYEHRFTEEQCAMPGGLYL